VYRLGGKLQTSESPPWEAEGINKRHATYCVCGLLLDPEDGGDMFLRKSVDFHRTTHVISQKTELFIATAGRTSHSTLKPCSAFRVRNQVSHPQQYNRQIYVIACFNPYIYI
jgi:hypothetical protein